LRREQVPPEQGERGDVAAHEGSLSRRTL
jgi:hypothetical protein